MGPPACRLPPGGYLPYPLQVRAGNPIAMRYVTGFRPLSSQAERMTAAGRAGQARTTQAMVGSAAFRWWSMGMSVAFFASLMGAYAGTLGWAAGTVLAHAATGRWPARAGAAWPPAGAADDPLAWADAR